MSILELMTSGGIGGILIMTFLGILSIFAIYIFLERFGAIRNANKVDPNFMNNIKDMVLDGKLDAAQALCTAESTPVARMIEKGISRNWQAAWRYHPGDRKPREVRSYPIRKRPSHARYYIWWSTDDWFLRKL